MDLEMDLLALSLEILGALELELQISWPHSSLYLNVGKMRSSSTHYWTTNLLFEARDLKQEVPTTCNHKVGVLISNTTIIFTLIFEWYVVWCGTKNIFDKNKYFTKIGGHTQNYNHFKAQYSTYIIEETYMTIWCLRESSL